MSSGRRSAQKSRRRSPGSTLRGDFSPNCQEFVTRAAVRDGGRRPSSGGAPTRDPPNVNSIPREGAGVSAWMKTSPTGFLGRAVRARRCRSLRSPVGAERVYDACGQLPGVLGRDGAVLRSSRRCRGHAELHVPAHRSSADDGAADEHIGRPGTERDRVATIPPVHDSAVASVQPRARRWSARAPPARVLGEQRCRFGVHAKRTPPRSARTDRPGSRSPGRRSSPRCRAARRPPRPARARSRISLAPKKRGDARCSGGCVRAHRRRTLAPLRARAPAWPPLQLGRRPRQDHDRGARSVCRTSPGAVRASPSELGVGLPRSPLPKSACTAAATAPRRPARTARSPSRAPRPRAAPRRRRARRAPPSCRRASGRARRRRRRDPRPAPLRASPRARRLCPDDRDAHRRHTGWSSYATRRTTRSGRSAHYGRLPVTTCFN